MILNMRSPIIRAAFGMFFGAALVAALRFVPALAFLNIWHAIGAGAIAAAGMVLRRPRASE